jgi:uncharacterized membrane-anchored protein
MKYWRSILLWGGLLAALVVANRGIVHHERTLADGRVLLLALEPVDPRAMLQGDYMALRFAAADDIRDAHRPPCEHAPGTAGALKCMEGGVARDGFEPRIRNDGYAVFARDTDNVGRFLRVQPAAHPVADGEVAVRYRERGWELRIASNAWFFPEGQAARYQPARYGELRVDAKGTALIAGLRDDKRKPL